MLLSELAGRLGALLEGNGDVEISGVAGIREARAGQITFLANPKYDSFLATTEASAVIMQAPRPNCPIPALIAPNPQLAFLTVLNIFAAQRGPVAPGVHPTAVIGERVRMGAAASIGPHVVICDDVVLGDRVAVLAGCYLGGGVRIGDDAFIYPNVVIREGTVLGQRVIVHSGAILGSDGFGFARDGGKIRKIPQIGNVEIGSDVEIGANTTIDRATTGTTRIGSGTKIDNLVMIAHNVQVGENSLLCAQVGISGSTILGSDVTLAGQVGVVGHIELGDGVQVGAQGGVTKSVPSGRSVSGYPALPHEQARRVYASMRHLPEMLRTIRDLCRRLEELERRPAKPEENA